MAYILTERYLKLPSLPWYDYLSRYCSWKKIEEIAVEFFNGFTKRTVGKGALKPESSLIVTLLRLRGNSAQCVIRPVCSGGSVEPPFQQLLYT